MGAESDCPFFFHFIHRNSLWEATWETCGVLRHWLIIKHRSHSVLTQLLLLLTAAMTQSFQRNTELPFTVMIYCIMMSTLHLWSCPAEILKGGVSLVRWNRNSMFKKLCLIIFTSPSLDVVSMNHHHTYFLALDQPSNWLPIVWLNCQQFYCCALNMTVPQRCKNTKNE